MARKDNQVAGYITAFAAAKHLGVSPTTVRRWGNEGTLPADWITPGGARRYRLATIERFIELHRGGAK